MDTIKKILVFSFILSCILLLSHEVYSQIYYSYGYFNLMLNQNGSIGVQQNEGYVEIKLTTPYVLNGSASIVQYEDSGILSFTSNTDGSIDITTNMETQVQVKDVQTTVTNNIHLFSFNNGDLVKISWNIKNPIYSALIGLVGIILFCATPVLSYYLSDNFREKFKFFFIFMGLGLVSVALILSFIYSGI